MNSKIEKTPSRIKSILDKKYQFILTRRKIFIISSVTIIAAIAIGITLALKTEIRRFADGYPSEEVRKAIIANSIAVDSIKQEIYIRDHYISSILQIVKGNDSVLKELPYKRVVLLENIEFNKFNHDSIFKEKIGNSLISDHKSNKKGTLRLSDRLAYKPVQGYVKRAFETDSQNIVLAPVTGSYVASPLDGTVISILNQIDSIPSYSVTIQHKKDVVSKFQGITTNLTKVGDKVSLGEAIGATSNSDSIKTNIIFELWVEGERVDPELYIKF